MISLNLREARKNKMFRELAEAAGGLLVDIGYAWRYDICENAGYAGMADQLDWRPRRALWAMTWELLNPGSSFKDHSHNGSDSDHGEGDLAPLVEDDLSVVFIYSATEEYFLDRRDGLYPPEDSRRFSSYLAGIGQGRKTAGWFIELDDNSALIRRRLEFERRRKGGEIQAHIIRVLSAERKRLLDAPSARLLEDLRYEQDDAA